MTVRAPWYQSPLGVVLIGLAGSAVLAGAGASIATNLHLPELERRVAVVETSNDAQDSKIADLRKDVGILQAIGPTILQRLSAIDAALDRQADRIERLVDQRRTDAGPMAPGIIWASPGVPARADPEQ